MDQVRAVLGRDLDCVLQIGDCVLELAPLAQIIADRDQGSDIVGIDLHLPQGQLKAVPLLF